MLIRTLTSQIPKICLTKKEALRNFLYAQILNSHYGPDWARSCWNEVRCSRPGQFYQCSCTAKRRGNPGKLVVESGRHADRTRDYFFSRHHRYGYPRRSNFSASYVSGKRKCAERSKFSNSSLWDDTASFHPTVYLQFSRCELSRG